MLPDQVTAKAKVLGDIPGVCDISINKVAHEREALSFTERCSILDTARRGLNDGQLLLAGVGELTEDVSNSSKKLLCNFVVSLAGEGERNMPCKQSCLAPLGLCQIWLIFGAGMEGTETVVG